MNYCSYGPTRQDMNFSLLPVHAPKNKSPRRQRIIPEKGPVNNPPNAPKKNRKRKPQPYPCSIEPVSEESRKAYMEDLLKRLDSLTACKPTKLGRVLD